MLSFNRKMFRIYLAIVFGKGYTLHSEEPSSTKMSQSSEQNMLNINKLKKIIFKSFHLSRLFL